MMIVRAAYWLNDYFLSVRASCATRRNTRLFLSLHEPFLVFLLRAALHESLAPHHIFFIIFLAFLSTRPINERQCTADKRRMLQGLTSGASLRRSFFALKRRRTEIMRPYRQTIESARVLLAFLVAYDCLRIFATQRRVDAVQFLLCTFSPSPRTDTESFSFDEAGRSSRRR